MFLLRFLNTILRVWGHDIHRWKGISICILQGPKFLENQLVNPKKQICMTDYKSRWSKEPQCENNNGSFLQCGTIQFFE